MGRRRSATTTAVDPSKPSHMKRSSRRRRNLINSRLSYSMASLAPLEIGVPSLAPSLPTSPLPVLSKLVVRGWQLPQSRRECLVVDTWRDEDSISGIVGLLESSPNLDTLVIQCCDSYEESVKTWGPVARDDLDCDLLHLKTVRFIDYANPNLAGEPMLTMARILLKRATALEKMVIDAEEHLTKFSSDFTKIAQIVFSYPRSSKKVVVVLHE